MPGKTEWKWRLGNWAITILMVVPTGMFVAAFLYGIVKAMLGEQ